MKSYTFSKSDLPLSYQNHFIFSKLNIQSKGNDTLFHYIQLKQKEFNKQFTKEKSSSFFSGIPKGVYALTQSFKQLISHYLIIITMYIKANNYLNSLKIFLFLNQHNDECLLYLFEKIKKNYPLSSPNNNINKFYPPLIISYLQILSSLIKLTSFYKKNLIQTKYIRYYLEIIFIIQKTISDKTEIKYEEKGLKSSISFITFSTLYNLSLYTLYNYYPIITSIMLLEKMKSFYRTSSKSFLPVEIDFISNELFPFHTKILLLKACYNLGLLYYMNNSTNDSIQILECGKRRIKVLNENHMLDSSYAYNKSPIFNGERSNKTSHTVKYQPKRSQRKSLTIQNDINHLLMFSIRKQSENELDGIKTKMEVLLSEIHLESNNYIQSFYHVKKALELINSTNAKYYRSFYVKERTILAKVLEKIEQFQQQEEEQTTNNINEMTHQNIFQITSKLYKEFKTNENKSELNTNNSKDDYHHYQQLILNGNDTEYEIEKFFIFINKLSLYQIKVLNDYQPKDDVNRNDLPILFPSQFKDCLTHSQRISLDNLKPMSLLRYLILKDPNKLIMPNNLNYELITNDCKDNENKRLDDVDKKSKRSLQRNKIEKRNYDEIINRVRNENMKNELIKNKKLVFKILKKLTEEEKKELIEQPELIGESIWDLCKGVNEECLCNESKNDNESYCLENVGDNFSNCNNNGIQFHDRIEINSESIFE